MSHSSQEGGSTEQLSHHQKIGNYKGIGHIFTSQSRALGRRRSLSVSLQSPRLWLKHIHTLPTMNANCDAITSSHQKSEGHIRPRSLRSARPLFFRSSRGASNFSTLISVHVSTCRVLLILSISLVARDRQKTILQNSSYQSSGLNNPAVAVICLYFILYARLWCFMQNWEVFKDKNILKRHTASVSIFLPNIWIFVVKPLAASCASCPAGYLIDK